MNFNVSIAKPGSKGFKSLLTATLLACAGLSAQAASFTFSGVTDSGSLLGTAFSGSFSFTDPTPGLDGGVDLNAFSLNFAGNSYSLASADAGAVPDAFFSAGSLIGVEYQSTSSADASLRPHVQFTAGFTDLNQAFFSYDATGAGVEGYGSYSLSAVPEPASCALLLVGLAAIGMVARRRRH
jgi:hypothetical protein